MENEIKKVLDEIEADAKEGKKADDNKVRKFLILAQQSEESTKLANEELAKKPEKVTSIIQNVADRFNKEAEKEKERAYKGLQKEHEEIKLRRGIMENKIWMHENWGRFLKTRGEKKEKWWKKRNLLKLFSYKKQNQK